MIKEGIESIDLWETRVLPDRQMGAELEAARPPLEDPEEVDEETGEDGAPGVREYQLGRQESKKWLRGLETNIVCKNNRINITLQLAETRTWEYFSEDGC